MTSDDGTATILVAIVVALLCAPRVPAAVLIPAAQWLLCVVLELIPTDRSFS